MSNIGFNLAGGLSALGSLGCLFNTASVVTKAIKGDGQPTSFQRLLNNTFGEAQTKASETGRQALEAVAWGASALLLAGISWTCVDTSELSFPSFPNLFSPSDTDLGAGDSQGGGDLLGTVGGGVSAAFTAAVGAAGAATDTTIEFVAGNPGTSAGLGLGGAAALGTAAAAKAAGGIGAAAGAAAGAVRATAGAVAGAGMDAAGKLGNFIRSKPTAGPVADPALGGAAS